MHDHHNSYILNYTDMCTVTSTFIEATCGRKAAGCAPPWSKLM